MVIKKKKSIKLNLYRVFEKADAGQTFREIHFGYEIKIKYFQYLLKTI